MKANKNGKCEVIVKSLETTILEVLRWGVKNRIGSIKVHNKIQAIRKKQIEAEEALGVYGRISEWTVKDVDTAMRNIARGVK